MRNGKATAPIIQGAETMDEHSCFVACFLYTVLIFYSFSTILSLLCVR